MCKMSKKREEPIEGEALIEHDESESEDDEEEDMDDNVGKREKMPEPYYLDGRGWVIDVAFDARPPCDSDFHGVKRLLQQLFVKNINEDLSELANLICAQDFVGCVLKQDQDEDSDENGSDEDSEEDDDDHVFAISTVINVSENQSLSCIEKINELLMSKCEESYKTEPSRMTKLLGDPSKQIGLIISERFINIPPQVALPSYQSLKSDIEKAVRKKKKFNFSNLVLISKTYRTKGGGPMGAELFYSNPEEQLFSEMCEFSYTFSVADQRDSVSDGKWDDDGGDFESLRTVMVFDASALGHMIDKLLSEVPPT